MGQAQVKKLKEYVYGEASPETVAPPYGPPIDILVTRGKRATQLFYLSNPLELTIGRYRTPVVVSGDCLNSQPYAINTGVELGTGLFGTVFVACLNTDCNFVAKLQLSNNSIDFGMTRKARIAQELAVLSDSRLADQRLVPRMVGHVMCPLLSGGGVGELSTIVMERVQGVTLAEFLRQPQTTEDMATGLLTALATALLEFQELGYVHSDLHLGNVMVLTDGSVRLIDMGFAHKATDVGSRQKDWATLYSGLQSTESLRPALDSSAIISLANCRPQDFQRTWGALQQQVDMTRAKKTQVPRYHGMELVSQATTLPTDRREARREAISHIVRRGLN